MKNIIKIFIILIFVACKSDLKKVVPKSSFELKNDFFKISETITELDTVVVLIDLTLYHHDFRNEKLQIISFGDSLKILISGRVGFEIFDNDGNEIENEYKQLSLRVQGNRIPEVIIIHKKEVLWNFDSLISKNVNSLVSTKGEISVPQLIFYNNLDTLSFDFSSKKEWKTFKKEYCKMMFKLTPENEFYNSFVQDFFAD